MPTTLPSPVDRGEFRFVAVDEGGAEWLWIDEELVWRRVAEGKGVDVAEGEGRPTH